ncbi:unnamed protein product [Heterosigma akashiwo]
MDLFCDEEPFRRYHNLIKRAVGFVEGVTRSQMNRQEKKWHPCNNRNPAHTTQWVLYFSQHIPTVIIICFSMFFIIIIILLLLHHHCFFFFYSHHCCTNSLP